MTNYSGSYGNYQQRYGGSSTPTVKNPSTSFNKGPEFNDRDRLNDMLATEKWLTDGFNVFVRETSHKDLYNDILHVLTTPIMQHGMSSILCLKRVGIRSIPSSPATLPSIIRSFPITKVNFPAKGRLSSEVACFNPSITN